MASSIPARNIRLKRAYEAPSHDDGARVLVDRLWPRGISKQKAALDEWMKEIAPSTELREWFGHDPARWAEFQKRYAAELRANRTGLTELRAIARRGKLTLIYAAQDALQAQSHVEGDIFAQSLAIEQGAYFEGKSRRSDNPLEEIKAPGANGSATPGSHSASSPSVAAAE